MNTIPKRVTNISDVTSQLHPIYEFQPGSGEYELTPGGRHLQILRDVHAREQSEAGISNAPLPHGAYERALSREMPEITLRDWTTTIAVAAAHERIALMRALSAGKIKIKR